MQTLGNQAFFAALAGMQLALAAFALYRMTRRGPVPAAQKTAYVGVPPGTSSSGEMIGHVSDEALP